MKKMLTKYRVELFAVLIALLGAILLLDRGRNGQELLPLVSSLRAEATKLGGMVIPSVVSFFSKFSTQDLAGAGLVLLATLLILGRLRHRFLTSERWMSKSCPRCGSSLQRIHRTPFDHFLGKTLLPHSRRYQCTNEACRWSGLCNHVHHSHKVEEDSQVSTF